MVLFVVSLLLAFSLSGLCSLMEATLLSLTPGQIAKLRVRRPYSGALCDRFKKNIDKPITAILTLNTAAHTIGATVAGSQFAIIFDNHWVGLFSLLFTYFMLQFTEILPKTLGIRFNTFFAPFVANCLVLMINMLNPLIYLIRLVNRPFEGGLEAEKKIATTMEEIKALASMAFVSKQISPHQEKIIRQATRLSTMSVLELAIPVNQITFLSESHSLADALIAAHADPHTRFPVIQGDDPNCVLGYVNFKELVYRVRTNPTDPTMRGIIRPVHFVTKDTTCTEMIKMFIDEHAHMAIVRDENGKTVGLITLEDLVEELIGEVEDEFDRLPRMFQALSGGVWIVGGGLPFSELARQIGLEGVSFSGSVSSWIVHRYGGVPPVGTTFTEGAFDVNVRRIRRGKVFEILVTPKGKAPPAIAPAPSHPASL